MIKPTNSKLVAEVIQFLEISDETQLYPRCHVSATLDHTFDISPEEFLEFAERDLANNNKHGMINALTNAKRAIDAETDKILHCFNLHRSHLNFPAKAKLLQQIGIITPRIIDKLVKLRNKLEHEYKHPTIEQVADAVDTAYLFVLAADSTLHLFPELLNIGTAEDEQLQGFLDPQYDKIVVIEFSRRGKEIYVGFHRKDPDVTTIEHLDNKPFEVAKQHVLTPKDNEYTEAIRISSWANKARKSIVTGESFLKLLKTA